MNRTDRLYALVEELRFSGERGRTSVWLAERFEVSTRTIKRDILALQQAGLPIWSQPGPGGGHRMLTTRTALPPVTFTVGEGTAIAVALNTQAHLPFATEGSIALTKILGAIGPAERSEVNHLLERVWTTTSTLRTRAARTVDSAIQQQRVVALTYSDSRGVESVRRVDPLQFAQTGGNWYLLAYCRKSEAGRWFRLDRIKAARLCKESSVNYSVEDVIGLPPTRARSLAQR